ncbi:hypothetical protein FQA39_LY02012 [Lamprigera yunnana]|nr:hypothetical protein FQA39_LY02012 [Lamprigera yunnana]
MPSTKDATLKLIQREINEVVQREKELKDNYSRSESLYENGISDSFQVKPHLERAKSVSSLTNAKGVMQRFIKSRGRVSSLMNTPSKNQTPAPAWMSLELSEPAKAIVPTGVQPRNGFVPVEERIRREFQDMQKRECELRVEREKSQPDLLAVLQSSPEPRRRSLHSTSVVQLNDYESYNETISAPPSLKGAKSLSDLCDIEDECTLPPGSHNLIKQWETLIKKNQNH